MHTCATENINSTICNNFSFIFMFISSLSIISIQFVKQTTKIQNYDFGNEFWILIFIDLESYIQ